MRFLLHRARLLLSAIADEDLAFALRVAALHERDLRWLLEPPEASDDVRGSLEPPDAQDGVQAAEPGDAPDSPVQTAARLASVPLLTVALAASLEGRFALGVSVAGADHPEDERRLWRYVLDHPRIGEPLRELLATVDWMDVDAATDLADLGQEEP